MYATTDKEIMAIDAETCRTRWRVREDGPSLGLPINRGAAFLDGRLFRGAGTATLMAYDASTGRKPMEKHAYAFDAATGKVLWQTELLGAAGGGVITYLIDGKQRVAFVTGTHSPAFPVSPSSARIVIFGL
jgi:outer membrane protein assembly factor BamB